MTLRLEVDVVATAADGLPTAARLQQAADAAFAVAARSERPFEDTRIVGVRIVDAAESAALNEQWRQKAYATNVLAFPAAPPVVHLDDEPASGGDLVICAPVVLREAAEQGKTPAAHCLHMLVHGCLHLLGYDHLSNDDAELMEALERQALAALDIADPY